MPETNMYVRNSLPSKSVIELLLANNMGINTYPYQTLA